MTDCPMTPDELLELYRRHPDGVVDVDYSVLATWPALAVGQADDLIAEAPNELRVWVSRVALADMSEEAFSPGDPIGSLEWWRNDRWEQVPLVVCER
jgi:hypothetical protein